MNLRTSPVQGASDAALEATKKQRIASDPGMSSWVGASAGSGKTKVLTDRFLRLMLPRAGENSGTGTPPEKILAITFTRAGANEMAIRLSRRLSRWAIMTDADLMRDMEDNLLGRTPTAEEMEAARKLFARVTDTPGGLRIMTIHSFCQSVLARFPVEAGLQPHFKPLDEVQAAELLDRAWKEILSSVPRQPAAPLSEAIRRLSLRFNEKDLRAIVQSLIAERHQMETILRRMFGVDGLYTNLCVFLSITPGQDEEKSIADFCIMPEEYAQRLRTACTQLYEGKKTDIEKAARMDAFLAGEEQSRPLLYSDYKKAFLTGEGTPYAKPATGDVLKKYPEITDLLSVEAARIQALEEILKAVRCTNITRDLFRLGDAILSSYAALKESRGALDFDDLIIKTLSLLKGDMKALEGLSAHTPWILYKMDEGIDHILVDEAQDTNPEQWEIIRLLSDDFFDGAARDADTPRTIFVVGDQKQSIFSFQRAAPEKFGDMHTWYERRIAASKQKFAPVDINTSFRSVQVVLDAVDSVYAQDAARRGVGARYAAHSAHRAGHAGRVEFWPVLKTDGSDKEKGGAEGWDIPSDITETLSGSRQMAIKISETIKGWLDRGEILPARGRAIRPGDIMVLVRARTAFVPQLIRELKYRHIPVSGSDRMVLADQLAVQDLCAAASFALLPEDDLTLACLLKSPFIGLSEEALYELSCTRPRSLWESVCKNGDSIYVSWLSSLIARAGNVLPYDFFNSLLQTPCPANKTSGLMAIRERLGAEALDSIDEFLNQALGFEASHSTGLQGFLKFQSRDGEEIKRQMDDRDGMVQIMTVHGSKGLQAPIVFMPDTIRTPSGSKTEPVLWPQKTGMDVPVYLPASKDLPAALTPIRENARQLADDEYRRLLYVAMTRAEDRLYVGGFYNKRGPTENTVTWYEDIRSGLSNLPGIHRSEEGEMVLESTQIATPVIEKNLQEDELHTIVPPLPTWAHTDAPPPARLPKPLIPSRDNAPDTQEEPAFASPMTGKAKNERRFQRGTLTHRLLQLLPSLPQDRRRAKAQAFLARPAFGLSRSAQADILDETFRLLDDPVFGEIFGPQSRAEIPLTGMLDDQTLLSGQIDRLLVRERDILIIDFKTNRPPPQDPADVPELYMRQMRAYARALRLIYPDRAVRAALLWTDGARLMEVES